VHAVRGQQSRGEVIKVGEQDELGGQQLSERCRQAPICDRDLSMYCTRVLDQKSERNLERVHCNYHSDFCSVTVDDSEMSILDLSRYSSCMP